MTDTFDQDHAERIHWEIIHEAQRIRDGLSHDVIDYYYHPPTSEKQEDDQRDGMRKYLRLAAERIDELLRHRFFH